MSTTPIDLPTKLRMAFLYGCQLTQRDIADMTETSKSSVNRVLQLLDKKQEEEISYDFVIQLQYHFILYKVLQNPFITYHQIYISMTDFDFQISESTIGRICNSLQIRNKFQQRKEKLTQLHKINRVTFSENYLKCFLSNFPLVFSDESMVALQPFRKKIKVMPIFQNDEYFFDKCRYPIKIMIWGCIGFNFKSKLILIKEKLNSKEYLRGTFPRLLFFLNDHCFTLI